MLQIHADILAQPPKSDNAAILALDLHKAFDHVSHHAILDSVNHHNLGSRTHTYITNFLSNRTATLRLGSLHTTTFPMPSRGTPQGAVLSRSPQLEAHPNLRSAIYADDITLYWVPSGSDAMIEETSIREPLSYTSMSKLPVSPALSPNQNYLYYLHGDPGPPPYTVPPNPSRSRSMTQYSPCLTSPHPWLYHTLYSQQHTHHRPASHLHHADHCPP
ncbi:hypothetical protein HPB48_004096 [Haemaphysalis longicornis]|uniref:Reverse transcriptase domain-containing protein n=1 Tax=Haemaphysalis longicornis TaxID=44386 RepID=A0A9J6FNR1_HAELO|nr:hypothetical protein HPB48_004096 [Haemaphysalis longicornis]